MQGGSGTPCQALGETLTQENGLVVNFKISIAVCLMLPDQMVTCLTHFKTSLRNSLMHKQTLAEVSFYNSFNILNIKIKQKQRYHKTSFILLYAAVCP